MTGGPLLGASADAAVRPATAGDAPAMAAIHERAWRSSYGDLLPAGVLDGLATVAVGSWRDAVAGRTTPWHQVLVATAADVVTGFAAASPATDPDSAAGTVELVALEVDPLHRSTGHGSRLLNAIGDNAAAAGASLLVHWCPEVDDERRRFMQTAGFELDGARREHDTGHGTLWAEMRLSAALTAG